jgi:hypothetical protein
VKARAEVKRVEEVPENQILSDGVDCRYYQRGNRITAVTTHDVEFYGKPVRLFAAGSAECQPDNEFDMEFAQGLAKIKAIKVMADKKQRLFIERSYEVSNRNQ